MELTPNESVLLGYFQSRAAENVHVLDLGLGKVTHEAKPWATKFILSPSRCISFRYPAIIKTPSQDLNLQNLVNVQWPLDLSLHWAGIYKTVYHWAWNSYIFRLTKQCIFRWWLILNTGYFYIMAIADNIVCRVLWVH